MKPLVPIFGLLVLAITVPPKGTAQVRSAGAASVSLPMPAAAFAGLQNILASPIGASLLTNDPSLNPLRRIVSMSPSAPETLQALGPLTANLPADFSARIEAARTSGSAAPLADVLAQAYSASVPAALAEIEARARVAAKLAASDANAWRGLGSAASDLEPYSLYGEAARERVALFAQKAAAVRSQELAKSLSQELLLGLRGPGSALEGVSAGSIDEGSFARRHARLAKSFRMTSIGGRESAQIISAPRPVLISAEPVLLPRLYDGPAKDEEIGLYGLLDRVKKVLAENRGTRKLFDHVRVGGLEPHVAFLPNHKSYDSPDTVAVVLPAIGLVVHEPTYEPVVLLNDDGSIGNGIDDEYVVEFNQGGKGHVEVIVPDSMVSALGSPEGVSRAVEVLDRHSLEFSAGEKIRYRDVASGLMRIGTFQKEEGGRVVVKSDMGAEIRGVPKTFVYKWTGEPSVGTPWIRANSGMWAPFVPLPDTLTAQVLHGAARLTSHPEFLASSAPMRFKRVMDYVRAFLRPDMAARDVEAIGLSDFDGMLGAGVGVCRHLATLTAAILAEAGYRTNLVVHSPQTGDGHAWIEAVSIEDSETVVIDPMNSILLPWGHVLQDAASDAASMAAKWYTQRDRNILPISGARAQATTEHPAD